MTLMTVEDMQEFVDKVSKEKVLVKKVDVDVLEPYAGYTYIDDDGTPTIEVSDSIFLSFSGDRTSKAFVKAFLLHELGHLNTKESELPYKNEYNAHMWAINKSMDLKLRKVTQSLREEIVSWQNLEDNEDFGKYVEASKQYLEKHGFVI